jgi:ABC-type uncharacterized transport system involved in gliding motility auxiliary subunit
VSKTGLIESEAHMTVEEQVAEHERRLLKLEICTEKMGSDIAKLLGSAQTVELLLKWVILPLIIIVGGLVGIKLALPTS